MTIMAKTTASCIVRVSACDLRAVDRSWAFAGSNAEAIDFHWDKRRTENPNFFDGRIYMLAEHTLDNATLRGQFFETGFKQFLYWRDHGSPEAGVRDAFGSALLRGADGGVLLGYQRPGNVNTGYAYVPGGFIDARDVDGSGRIDIAASTAREILEETGLVAAELEQQPGFILTLLERQMSIAVEYRSHLPAAALRERVMAHLDADTASELSHVVVVSNMADLASLEVAPYTRVLLAHIFNE